MIKDNRKIILGVGILISFALLVFSISMYYNYIHDSRQASKLTSESIDGMSIDEIKSFLEQRQDDKTMFHSFYLIPFVAFIGIIVGTLVYYIMSDKVVHQEQSLKKNTKIILNFLTAHERKVIETLLEQGGKVQQYELSHLPGLNKLKTHRILVNLEQKGIVKKEKLGKINKIVLNKELFEVLS